MKKSVLKRFDILNYEFGKGQCAIHPVQLTCFAGKKIKFMRNTRISYEGQGCINCAILLSGIGARGVSSEHMEDM